jgi:rhodanese-related sulfurtransferase
MKRYTVQDIHALLPEIQAGKYTLIDIRSPEEWRQTGVMEEAVLMTYPNNPALNSEWALDLQNHFDLETQLILSCRSGMRSAAAIQLLEAIGFSDLINVEGGILAWLDAAYPVKMPSA